jgi:uncharacterized iron-regulated membrane protein
MEQKVKTKSFSKRAFISTALFVSGLMLPFSGYLNHFYQFEDLSLERHFWMSVHNVAGILFLIFAVLHIAFNWKALLNYAKRSKVVLISKEALTALLLVILIVAIFSSHAFHAGK